MAPGDARPPRPGAALVPAVLAVGLLVVLAAATDSSWHIEDRFGVFGAPPNEVPASPRPQPSGSPLPRAPLEDSGVGNVVVPLLWAVLVLAALALAYWIWRVLPRAAPKTAPAAPAGGAATGQVEGPDAPLLAEGVGQAQQLLDAVADPTDAVLAAWVALEDAAARSGVARQPSDTPTELTTRVLTATPADADAVATLLGLYHRARFSAAGVGPDAVTEARRCLAVLAASWSRFPARPGLPP